LKKLKHFAEIYSFYDTYIIDLWGVMHNGVNLYEDSMEVVKNLFNENKKVVFLSNAPRPIKDVIEFLKKINMEEKYLNNVMTSGEAAVSSIKNKKFGTKFYHLGPERDSSLYQGLEKDKTNLESSDFILCTGLFDDNEKNLDYYKKLLEKSLNKKLICTNPDLIVHRGNVIEYCAGTIAEIFKSLGGQVVYFGKPYKEVYDLITKKGEKSFIVGDNLNTDIKGANNLQFDSLFITNGIHRSEFNSDIELKELLKKHKVNSKYFQNNLKW